MTVRTDAVPRDYVAVTPTDGAAVNLVGIRNGGASAVDVAVRTRGGGANNRTIRQLQPGETVLLGIVEVRATGTSAGAVLDGYVG